jgi:hypothetical protein
MKSIRLLTGLFALLSSCISAQTNTVSGTINLYASVTGINSQTLTVSNASGFLPCDRVLIIQMKGVSVNSSNTINYGSINAFNNAGKYEFATISAVNGNALTLNAPLQRMYSTNGLVQVIRVPVYNNAVVNGSLSCADWNGTTGGVLVFEVCGTLSLNGTINVSGKGFRGGAVIPGSSTCQGDTINYVLSSPSLYSAQKGEGVFISTSQNNLGKGKNANGGGGGNDINGGGAGGGNYGAGGMGGDFISPISCPPNYTMFCGGISGQNLPYSNTLNLVFMGGGGGAGQQNNGTSTAGGNGGGIIIIRSNSIVGNTNFIRADGNNVPTTNSIDGQGGGGAGGTILLDVQNFSSLNVSARGGTGGSDTYNGWDCHAKGGGGGGGIVWLSSTQNGITTSLNGGNPGVFLGNGSPCYNTSLGATGGMPGGILGSLILQGALPTCTSLSIVPNGTVSCSSPTMQLQVTPVFANSTFQWTGPSILGPTSGTSVITASAGVYSCTVTYCNGLTAVAVYTVLGQASVLVITASASAQGFCSGMPTTLVATGASTYTWFPGSLTGSIITAFPPSSMVFTVSGTVGTCQSSQTLMVHVNPSPVLSLSPPNSSLCQRSSVNVTVSGADTYTWSNGFTGPTVSLSPMVTTVYTVMGANSVSGCTTSLTHTVTVLSLPVLAVAGPTVACFGEMISYTASGAMNYTWSFGGNGSQITHSPANSSVYLLTGSSAEGCTATLQFTLTLNECVSLNEIEANENIKILPNPVSGKVSIEFIDGLQLSISSIELVNLNGVIVKKFTETDWKKTDNGLDLDLSVIQQGTYVLVVNSAEQTLRRKLIKQ